MFGQSLIDIFRVSPEIIPINDEKSTEAVKTVTIIARAWDNKIAGMLVPVFAGALSYKLSAYFIKKTRNFGIDYHKRESLKIPESIGLSSGVSFVFSVFTLSILFKTYKEPLLIFSNSIILNILLGYVDDTLELPWSFKIIFPLLSITPIGITYTESTLVFIPFLKAFDLGRVFYLFLLLLSIYFTNSINILSGINGVETGQVLVMSFMVVIDRIIFVDDKSLLSGLLAASLFCSTLGLFMWNKYPSKCFVGDTFCYFSGASFLCIGLFGGFMKTLFLFFLPQLLNFLMSFPQLLKIIPCPRHRMPEIQRDKKETDSSCMQSDSPLKEKEVLLIPSEIVIPRKTVQKSILKRLIISTYLYLGLISYTETEESIKISNFTVLNTILVRMGPMQEKNLFYTYIIIQSISCSLIILAKTLLVAL